MAGRAADGSEPVEIVEWGELGADALTAWRGFALERENPFCSPDWLAACVEAGAAARPVVLVARGERGYSGFLALDRGGLRGRALRLPGHRLADWYEPACPREQEPGFLAGCGAALGRLGCGALTLDRWAGGVEPLLAPGGRLRRRRARPDDVLPFVTLGEGGWEEYLAERSRNFRSQLGRRRRKLEAGPGLDFRLADADSLASDWETFVRLHRARWSERGEASALAGEGGRVHRAFADAAFERGWLRLWTMSVGGEPAGAWYGWRLGDRYGYQLSGFDPAQSKAGIGVVLLAHTIEQAAAEGARTYDLLWGDEPYKTRFETGRRTVPSTLLTRPWSVTGTAARGAADLRAAGRRMPSRLRRLARR